MKKQNGRLFTERIRVTRLVIIALLMNTILFLISYFFNLPLWLDTTGTIYISCIIGFPAGFLVAILMNANEAVWIYGESSLLFYFVSLLTALTAGKIYDTFKHTWLKKWLLMFVALLIVDCGSAILITIITSDGIPSNYWSNWVYHCLYSRGYSNIISTCISVSAVKFLDLIVTLFIVSIAIRITPVKLKTKNVVLLEKESE